MADAKHPAVTDWAALAVWLVVAVWLVTKGDPVGFVRSRLGRRVEVAGTPGEAFTGDGLSDAIRQMEA